MALKEGMLVEMVPWVFYENEGEDCSMLVPSDAYPNKFYGVVLSLTPQPSRPNGTPKQDLAEVLFNDGHVVQITCALLREVDNVASI